MTFEQLRYFLAIVQYKTFTAAADELYISQSSLSKSIKALENELGCELFSRGSKNVELTTEGQAFYNYAKKAELNRLNMLNELSFLKRNVRCKEVNLGVLPVMEELRILDFITDFQNRLLNSNTYVNLVEGDQDDLIKQLNDGKLDAAIIRTDELNMDIYSSKPFLKNELVAVCSKNNPEFRSYDSISLSCFANYPFIEFDKSSFLQRKVRKLFESSGVLPYYTFSYKRHQQILSMVNANYGVAIIPYDLIDSSRYPDIQIHHLEYPVYTTTSIVWRKDSPVNETVNLLVDFFALLYPVDEDTMMLTKEE